MQKTKWLPCLGYERILNSTTKGTSYFS